MLRVSGLRCVRGQRQLFAGLNFELKAGQCLYVRGGNGAGKTSLLRMLVGLLPWDEGGIFWGDEPVQDLAENFAAQVMYLGHAAAVKLDFTALENLYYSAALDGQTLSPQQAEQALGRFGLRGRENIALRFFSAGQRRRTLLAKLLCKPAKLWVLDEPFTALDSLAIDTLNQLMQQHLQQGGMLVLTSHQAFAGLGAGASLGSGSASAHLAAAPSPTQPLFTPQYQVLDLPSGKLHLGDAGLPNASPASQQPRGSA